MNFRLLLVLVSLLSLAAAQSLMLVVESTPSGVTVKEAYTMDGDETSVPYSANATHYVEVGGVNYPLNLNPFAWTEVQSSQLYDSDGNQKYVPSRDEVFMEVDSATEVVVVPLASGVKQAVVTDTGGNTVASFSVADAKDYDKTFTKTAPKKLPETKQAVKSTAASVKPPAITPVSDQALWQMIIDVLVEKFMEALGL